MMKKDFFNLMQVLIEDNAYKGISKLNTPHAESYTERRDMYYMGVDWIDLYIKERSLFNNFLKKILNLKNLIKGFLQINQRKREISFLIYLLKKHELTHSFFVSVVDISVIKREMAEEMAFEEFLKLEDPYDTKSFELSTEREEKKENLFVLSRDGFKKAKRINELTEEFFNKISNETVRKKLELESIQHFNGVYIHKSWSDWVIDSDEIPFDMQNGWSFNKLSEIISVFLTSLLHHQISVKISNE